MSEDREMRTVWLYSRSARQSLSELSAQMTDLLEEAERRGYIVVGTSQDRHSDNSIHRAGLKLNLICIVMGICVLADALLKIQISIDSKAFGIQKWWLILAVAILTGAAGFLLLLRPSESAQVVMILLGVTLITEGVLNLITILTAVKIIRHQLPEVIDAEYCQIDPNRKINY